MVARDERPVKQIGLWHEGFYALMKERGAAGFEQVTEYGLSLRPRRADMLLIRRRGAVGGGARTLRGLWPWLSEVTLLEFKSPVRGFRQGDFLHQISYGAQYCGMNWSSLGKASALTLVLVMPRLNRALQSELAFGSWNLEPLGNGYARLHGVMYTTFVAFTNEVAEAEEDDFLRVFSDREVTSPPAQRWLRHFFLERHTMPELREREGYDEMMQKLLDSLPAEERLRGLPAEERLRGLPAEERLRGLPAEERLRGLPAEERLRGLPAEEAILALPVEVLRGLSEDYLRSLPEHVQRTVRARLARTP